MQLPKHAQRHLPIHKPEETHTHTAGYTAFLQPCREEEGEEYETNGPLYKLDLFCGGKHQQPHLIPPPCLGPPPFIIFLSSIADSLIWEGKHSVNSGQIWAVSL